MVSKAAVLEKLAPFKNYKRVVSTNQTVTDIIDGIVDTHYKWEKEYDKISDYFVGESELETARNIWNFLKSNVPYYIESTSNQTLRSPSAIVAMPGDCKSYALFANGILDSLNRKGILQVPLAFRFAGYKESSKEPQHVFAVMYPGTKKEIWIDPVLNRFNEKRQPSFYKDKKIKMALIALSGVGYTSTDKRAEMEAYRDKLVRNRDTLLQAGVITPGSSKELQYKVAINKATVALQDLPAMSGVWDSVKDFAKTSLQSNIDYASKGGPTNPAATVEAAIDTVKNLVSLFANKPNPNDWQGYDASDKRINAPIGTNAINWVINDGDSVQNEALNIVRYIEANGTKNILGRSTWFNRTITIEDVADKLSRGGFGKEAAQLVAASKVKDKKLPPPPPPAEKAGMNIFVTLGIVGAGIFLLSKMKK
jgi:hypothetical protein